MYFLQKKKKNRDLLDNGFTLEIYFREKESQYFVFNNIEHLVYGTDSGWKSEIVLNVDIEYELNH